VDGFIAGTSFIGAAFILPGAGFTGVDGFAAGTGFAGAGFGS